MTELKPVMTYIDGGSRHILALPKTSVFVGNMDYFVAVFERACKFKKSQNGVEIEFKCPLYSECNKQSCAVAEELRQLMKRMER
jgi:hypothetical protein